MKNKALLLIILFYLAFSATAQNVVYEIPVITKNSLIREYNNNIDIIYNHNGQSSFLLVDWVTGIVKEAVLPNPYIVTDMEIANDTYIMDDAVVHFCFATATFSRFRTRWCRFGYFCHVKHESSRFVENDFPR